MKTAPCRKKGNLAKDFIHKSSKDMNIREAEWLFL